MTIQEYVTKVLTDLDDQIGAEPDRGYWITVDFDIGVDPDNVRDAVVVEPGSTNRIKFSIEIKRGGK